MLNKKQFVTVLMTSVFVFAIIFLIFYATFYKKGLENSIVEPEVNVPVTPVMAQVEPVEEQVAGCIMPDTKVTLKVVDQLGTIVVEEIISTESILGFSEDQIRTSFKDYEIKRFTPEEVLMEKVVYQTSQGQVYKLSLQGDMIGIRTYGSGEAFTPLGLSIKDFSRTTHALLVEEAIEITAFQKAALEQNPHQIEQILQDYSE